MNHVSHEESLALVEEIESHDAECTASEERFVLSCRRILLEHGTLDDEEVARLERIVRKLDARVSDASDDDFEYEDDDDLYGDDEDDEVEDDLDEDDELEDDEDDFEFDDFEDDDDGKRAAYEDE